LIKIKENTGGISMKVNILERTNIWTLAIVAIAAVLAFVLAFNIQPASANSNEFDLTVKHGINGTSLGLDKDLPVDVYVNGSKAFTFSFKDIVKTSLPAGEYDIQVKLANTDTVVMSLMDADIPAGVDVSIRAKLSAEKTPVLKVQVK
jgi:cell division protein YceG involved in septum cleavage